MPNEVRQVEHADLVRCLSGSDPNGNGVVCPNCGSAFTHIKRAGTLMGGDEGHRYPGTEVVGTTAGRRSAVAIYFWCEGCPGGFALAVEQHKGMNEVVMTAWRDAEEPPPAAHHCG